MLQTNLTNRLPSGQYYALRGAWQWVAPGYQFNSTTSRAVGCIWQKGDLWYAQRYDDKFITTRKFAQRIDAEAYVRACNEESKNIALEKALEISQAVQVVN